MNHDYAHCLDYKKECPEECFRAELQRDIEENRSEFIGVPLTYAHLRGKEECELVRENKVDDSINRRVAIEEIGRWVGYIDEDMILRIQTGLKKLPSVQPERKTGHWIIHSEVKNIYGGTYIECSECGQKYVVQHIEDEKFCRNCGAYMRGEEDEQI